MESNPSMGYSFLKRNKISNIEDGAFEGMVADHFDFSGNTLKKVTTLMFDKSTISFQKLSDNEMKSMRLQLADYKPTELNLSFLEGVTEITALKLEHNGIDKINPGTFNPLKVYDLGLSKNKLTEIIIPFLKKKKNEDNPTRNVC
ncbi:hypothetical protein JTB14_035976 [Gonioctena quinquepunctata]|nr:hypothetical protein JTB14_035976 [Gonioctena quinquepunctata]